MTATLHPARTFTTRVRSVVETLRPGELVTYSDVAEEAGFPGAARAVGNVLRGANDLPWWRVVTASGRLVPGAEREHSDRLAAEGVACRAGAVEVKPYH